jgi:methylated-DNA-[protein]-cysteine S-methyltransferase
MNGTAEEILCTVLPAPPPLGPLLVAISTQGICRVEFGEDMVAFTAELAARSGVTVVEAPEPPQHVARQFADYFAGRRRRLTLPLDHRFMTPFQRQVFDILLEVPPGQIVTYRELAQAIGRPQASRGVGSAMAHNPLPILVPCHRVIRSDGTLAGYSAGPHIKEYLLALEGVMLPLKREPSGTATTTPVGPPP